MNSIKTSFVVLDHYFTQLKNLIFFRNFQKKIKNCGKVLKKKVKIFKKGKYVIENGFIFLSSKSIRGINEARMKSDAQLLVNQNRQRSIVVTDQEWDEFFIPTVFRKYLDF